MVVASGKVRALARARGYPSRSRGSSRGGEWGGGGGLPVPPVCPSSRAVRRVRPLTRSRAHVSCPSRDRASPRVACAVCSRAGRLSPRPPFPGSVPTTGEPRDFLLPSSGPGRVRVSRDGSRPRGRTFFGGTAVGRVRRVVGRRDPLPLEGSPSVGIGASASVSLVLASPRGSRGARWFWVGSVPRACGGTARGVCSVIPAGLASRARSPPERAVSRSLVRRFPGESRGGRPCRRRRPPSGRVVPPSRPSPAFLSLSSSGRPAVRAAGPPVRGAAGHVRVRAVGGVGGRRAARRVEGAAVWRASRSRGCGGVLASWSWRLRAGVQSRSSTSTSLLSPSPRATTRPGFTAGPSSSASRRVAGRRPVSRRPPSVCSLPARSRSPGPARRVRGVPRPRRCASLPCARGGPLRLPSSRELRRVPSVRLRAAMSKTPACRVSGGCPSRGGSTRASLGSDGWPSRSGPRRPPPARPAAHPLWW